MKSITKFRNVAVAMLLVFLTGAVTTSCEDEPGYDWLVGTWRIVAPPSEPDNMFTFYGDGTGTYWWPDDWGTSWNYYPFYWEAVGDELYIDFYNGDTWFYYYQLRGGSLYLYDDWNSTPLVYNIY